MEIEFSKHALDQLKVRAKAIDGMGESGIGLDFIEEA